MQPQHNQSLGPTLELAGQTVTAERPTLLRETRVSRTNSVRLSLSNLWEQDDKTYFALLAKQSGRAYEVNVFREQRLVC